MTYEELLAAAVYAPTLTGGTKPNDWNIGAQSFNGTSDVIITPAATTLGLGNLSLGSIWANPSNITGTRCIMEIGGLTHGFWVGIIGGFYRFSAHRNNASIGAIQGPAASIGVPAHLCWQTTPTGLEFFVDAISVGTVTVSVTTSSASDFGGVGAIYSDSRLPNGTAVDNGSTTSTNHFAGTLADPLMILADEGLAGATALFTGPSTDNVVVTPQFLGSLVRPLVQPLKTPLLQ